MRHLKKLFLFTAILFIFFFTSVVFAVPGQLNYELGTPATPQAPAQCDTTALRESQKAATDAQTLNSSCQTKLSTSEKIASSMKDDLIAEEKGLFMLEVVSGVFLFLLVIVTILLIKEKRTHIHSSE